MAGANKKTTIRRGPPCTKMPEEVKSTKSYIFSPSIAEKTTIHRGSPCTKMPEEVKSTKVHIFSPSIAEDVFSFLEEKEKGEYDEIFGNNGLELQGGDMQKFVYFLTSLQKETLTMWVEAMNPQLIVKICEEAEPDVLAEFFKCLGSSLMNSVLRVLNENNTCKNMREDKLHKLLFILEAYEYLHKIYLLDEAMLREGDYLMNINKSNKYKHSNLTRFFQALRTNSSASSASGPLPYSYMNSEGESCHLNQRVYCPVSWMNSDGESCHNYLRSQQQLHAVVNLKYKVVPCDTHAEMHISTDNVRCRVVYYPSCSGDLARSYYVCSIKIKVEPQPSDPRKLSSGGELSAAVDFPKLSVQVGATQSTTKDVVQWTYEQFDDGNNIGGMEWKLNPSYSGGDCVFSDDKYPESLIWRINQDITKPKTLCWRIRTHFYLKSSHNRNHIISHEVTQSFNSTI